MFTNTDVHWILTYLHSVVTVMYLSAVCSVLMAACLIKSAKPQVGSLNWTKGKGCRTCKPLHENSFSHVEKIEVYQSQFQIADFHLQLDVQELDNIKKRILL